MTGSIQDHGTRKYSVSLMLDHGTGTTPTTISDYDPATGQFTFKFTIDSRPAFLTEREPYLATFHFNVASNDVLLSGTGGSILVDPRMNPYKLQAWNNIKGEDGLVSDNPMVRNYYITEEYSKIYNDNAGKPATMQDTLPLRAGLYNGLAAFASAKVGAGMRAADLPRIFSGTAAGIYDTLARGNIAIYMDIQPSGLAYAAGGIEKVNELGSTGELHEDLVAGWQIVDDGYNAGDEAMMFAGLVVIVNHEQENVVQPVFDQHAAEFAGLSELEQFVFLTTAVPGGTRFWWYIGGNFGDLATRQSWNIGNQGASFRTWAATHSTINIDLLFSEAYLE